MCFTSGKRINDNYVLCVYIIILFLKFTFSSRNEVIMQQHAAYILKGNVGRNLTRVSLRKSIFGTYSYILSSQLPAYTKKIPHSKNISSLISKHVIRVRSDSKNKIKFIHHTKELLVRIQMNFKLFMNPAFELYTPLELNVSLNISRKTLAFVLNFLLLTLVYQFFSIQQCQKNKGRKENFLSVKSCVELSEKNERDLDFRTFLYASTHVEFKKRLKIILITFFCYSCCYSLEVAERFCYWMIFLETLCGNFCCSRFKICNIYFYFVYILRFLVNVEL